MIWVILVAIGFWALLESLRQGQYGLLIVGAIGTAIWYVNVWWLKRQGKTPRWW